MLPPRLREILNRPWLWTSMVYACGIALRILYTLRIQRPESLIYSDMSLYLGRARRMAAGQPLMPYDVSQALGYPAFLAFLNPHGNSLSRAVAAQLVVSCLLPVAVGLLGWVAFGRRTGLLAVVFASLYFPFIDYGALFLAEIHFIFWLALAFAGFLSARRARRRGLAIAAALGGGFAISVAASFKALALPAAFVYFVADGIATAFAVGARGAWWSWLARLRPWVLRGTLVVVGALPVLAVMSRACTRATNGRFCITGKEMGSDLLLGHYGRIADIEWKRDSDDQYSFGSPSAELRHYDTHARVPFSITDGPANRKEAFQWIGRHPGEAIVLSIDHVYDTFFGSSMWPNYNGRSWPVGNLSQYVFIALLFVPTLLAFATVARRGLRATVTSQTALAMAPIAALTITVMIATGEVRYRIPFDTFFIAIACAYLAGELTRIDDGTTPVIPSGTGAAPARS
ncbi:MAG TPA: hypothetical protein VKQ32_09360 [Polyangia bacterium]|nr:hypothetical protein [Polyangia bacterium]